MVDFQTFTYSLFIYGILCCVSTWYTCKKYQEEILEQEQQQRIARQIKREQAHAEWKRRGLVK